MKKHSCGFCDEEWVCSNTHDNEEEDAQPCQWENDFPCFACVSKLCRPATPWILVHFKEQPNTVKCERCGGAQECENNVSLDRYVHSLDYFTWQHKDCEAKDGSV